MAYIGDLQAQLVGRVRTHGERYFRKLQGGKMGLHTITEKSSKEDIIRFLHKISQT